MKLQKNGENESKLKMIRVFCFYFVYIIIIVFLDTFNNHCSMNMNHWMVLEKFRVLILLWVKFEN